jgi:hypothetical protein
VAHLQVVEATADRLGDWLFQRGGGGGAAGCRFCCYPARLRRTVTTAWLMPSIPVAAARRALASPLRVMAESVAFSSDRRRSRVTLRLISGIGRIV